MEKPNLCQCVLFSAFIALLSAPTQAAVIDSYTAATNDRFTNSPNFIASSFNLSGVGQSASGRWATLISPNVVVSAFHFLPGTGAAINFYPSNNPSSGAVQRTVTATNVKVGSTDLWLGVLDSNVPSSIKSFKFSNTLLTGTIPNGNFPIDPAGVFQGNNAYLMGRSPENFPAFQSQEVGRNLITGFSENVAFEGNSNNDSLILAYDRPGSNDYVQYESHVVVGDSGAPLFVNINGELVLLGTNAFRLDDANGNAVGSGINYIGNQSDFISNFIAVNAVPEPSSMCLAAFAAIAGYVAMRRRKVVCSNKDSFLASAC